LDLAGAFADAKKALELAPGDARVQNDYGVVLSQFGRLPEAIAAMERSIELLPRRVGQLGLLPDCGKELSGSPSSF